MQIKLGAKAFSSDDEPIGAVNHVVLYPGTKEITHLVVQSGPQSTTQRLVPVDSVYSADEKRIVLRQSKHDLEQIPEYDSSQEASTEPVDHPVEYTPTVRNTPEGTIMLKGGSKTITSDGHDVGNVERINTAENRITDLLISKPKLLKSQRRLIQTDLISSILENEVRLNVNSEFVDSLPEPLHEEQPMA